MLAEGSISLTLPDSRVAALNGCLIHTNYGFNPTKTDNYYLRRFPHQLCLQQLGPINALLYMKSMSSDGSCSEDSVILVWIKSFLILEPFNFNPHLPAASHKWLGNVGGSVSLILH